MNIFRTIDKFIPKGNSGGTCTTGKCPGPVEEVPENPFRPTPTQTATTDKVGTGMDVQWSTGSLVDAFLPGIAVCVVVAFLGLLWYNRK